MSEWKKVITGTQTSIREAMQVIEEGALRICLVCDQNQFLLGTVSDGDIRRGLLGHINMEDPVTLVMNDQPHTAMDSDSREHCLAVMDQLSILALPLVDSAGKLVGLETLHDAIHRPEFDNPVFIMAGGFGTRLQPLTDNCPKPMLKVGDKPMLEHLINRFMDLGFSNFYISTHYLPHVIRDHFSDGSQLGVRITYIHEEEPLGTGGALGLLPHDVIELPLIMMNGDVLTNLDFTKMLQHHLDSDCDATMCVREYGYQVPFGVVESKNDLITTMKEKPLYQYHVNAGIYILSSDLIKSIKKGSRIDMPTVLEHRINQSFKVGVYTSHDYWLDIGRNADYQRAQIDVKDIF